MSNETIAQMAATILAGFYAARFDRELNPEELRETAWNEAVILARKVKNRHEV